MGFAGLSGVSQSGIHRGFSIEAAHENARRSNQRSRAFAAMSQ